ncbi:putative serine/threonine protein kinase [Blattamonas nauphoetae]|uniref:Serine/threonine protein kinase n=1 Tax=Blattamonas nauphoetae TaxID=2049346 RepID=A0ABQ9YHR4_9EUKA|nr:putative serine/threonine protein kinase [Blattamonas nauphoetae]
MAVVNHRYLFVESLGGGTYGTVWKSWDLQEGKYVAIKSILPPQHESGIYHTTIQEISLLREIDHPNIVSLFDAFLDPFSKTLYLVQESMDLDLFVYLYRIDRSYISSAFIKSATYQCLSALAYLHSNWVIHRDLKPSNILLSNDGQVKLGDFGFARSFQTPIHSLPSDKIIVTPWYCPPEQVVKMDFYSPALDMWSMGCIFVELLIGRPLFRFREEKNQTLIDVMVGVLGDMSKEWPDIRSGREYFKVEESLAKREASQKPRRDTEGRLEREIIDGVKMVRKREITPEELDLCRRMLMIDPEKRITAQEALVHPYFRTRFDTEIREPPKVSLVEPLTSYRKAMKKRTFELGEEEKNFIKIFEDSCFHNEDQGITGEEVEMQDTEED